MGTENSCNQNLIKMAISNLLKKREYHVASPVKKKLMLKKEIQRLSKKLLKGGDRDDQNRGHNAQASGN